MPVCRALAMATSTARQEIAGGMPSLASTIAHEGPSATICSCASATRRPRRAFFISPRICRVPWVKVPQVSVVTNTRAESSASGWLSPAWRIVSMQNASSASARIFTAAIDS